MPSKTPRSDRIEYGNWRVDAKSGLFISFRYTDAEKKRRWKNIRSEKIFDEETARVCRQKFIESIRSKAPKEKATAPRPKKSYPSVKGWRVDPDSGRFMSFVYFDPLQKKVVRVTDDVPNNLFTIEEAEIFREKFLKSLAYKVGRAKRNAELIEKYTRYKQEHENYLKWIKAKAKNSWASYDGHLLNWVYPFFIDEHALVDPADWASKYNAFKEWLRSRPSSRINTKSTRRTLAVHTQNNIIRALNSYLSYLEAEYRTQQYFRCEMIPKEEGNKRGIKQVYSNKEIADLAHVAEQQFGPAGRICVRTLAFGALRAKECLGLHVDSVLLGDLVGGVAKHILRELNERGHHVYGFILLKDQLELDNARTSGGEVLRKALKGRKEISLKVGRYIPIYDLELAKELAGLIDIQEENFAQLKYGHNRENYLLFDGITYPKLYECLTEARTVYASLAAKDLHCLRHTGATTFARLCDGDLSLTKLILGHAKDEQTENYVHLKEEMEAEHKQLAQRAKRRDHGPIKPIVLKKNKRTKAG